ncbi:MAG TPA: YihY/virulence factor BrkB family protein [Candidatus Acidoferrales bacterium]|nr:YihY/virulence factor BrkB family protein [Candidatus Acidoferrales bacterium]
MTFARTFYRIWTESRLSVQAAALAFFAVLAIPPLLVAVIELVGFVPGYTQHALLRDRIFSTVGSQIGSPVAGVLRSLVDAAYAKSQSRNVATAIFGWAAIVFAATGLFAMVQGALESVWGSRPKGSIWQTARDRALAAALVAVLALAALVWVAGTAAVSIFSQSVRGWGPAEVAGEAIVGWLVLSLAITPVLKLLPHAPLRWNRALQGAAITAAFLVAGQFAIGWYVDRNASADAYGVATATIALVIWVYYSSLLFLAGAALTRVLAIELDRV